MKTLIFSRLAFDTWWTAYVLIKVVIDCVELLIVVLGRQVLIPNVGFYDFREILRYVLLNLLKTLLIVDHALQLFYSL